VRIRLGSIAFVIALLALAACGIIQPNSSSQTATGDDMRYNPCLIVSHVDVSQVLGGTFTTVETENPPVIGLFAERDCAYTSPDGLKVLVQTQLDDQPGGTIWKASVDNAMSDPESYEVIPNVGDEAFYAPGATVVVRRGILVVTISVIDGKTDQATKPPLKALANTASWHIGG
jgi:hypothetical protein